MFCVEGLSDEKRLSPEVDRCTTWFNIRCCRSDPRDSFVDIFIRCCHRKWICRWVRLSASLYPGGIPRGRTNVPSDFYLPFAHSPAAWAAIVWPILRKMYVQLWLYAYICSVWPYNWAAGSKFEWLTFFLGKHRDLVFGCLSLRCFYHYTISSVHVLRMVLVHPLHSCEFRLDRWERSRPQRCLLNSSRLTWWRLL